MPVSFARTASTGRILHLGEERNVHAIHAAISIRYWFAIDIAIRYRYRSYRAFSIARGPRYPLRLGCAVVYFSSLRLCGYQFFVCGQGYKGPQTGSQCTKNSPE
uniref:Uncharacterized protein n=1 Tax=Candidatus Kentrum sp. FM TaxID=2126340 RepID=A0A450SYW7_9GAMM|nr:MAG: hypothetical protein BECKFM1743C_GA0114222_102464 [Candidatus Kentron sp. FM]VFJ60170.1 MAG: hypothetical protein BECKFM1743A_GA0114220_102575 [Candidatus Kentron sp. FM]VFK12419.1 MAG: hypothetical protein BECKFM1743B_GA0114221_102415 [Candidatus Kentron sp. FM]